MVNKINEPRMLSADEVRAIKEGIDDLQFSQDDVENLCYTVDRLRAALISLKADPMGNDEWGIKCIEDHNAIIDEALGGAPEPPNNDAEIARLAREYVAAYLSDTNSSHVEIRTHAALIAAVEQEGR